MDVWSWWSSSCFETVLCKGSFWRSWRAAQQVPTLQSARGANTGVDVYICWLQVMSIGIASPSHESVSAIASSGTQVVDYTFIIMAGI